MPKQPEFDKQILNHTVYVSSIMNMYHQYVDFFMVCNLPKHARNSPNLRLYSVRRHPKNELEPYKPQITNDDPSFHQVSYG